MTIGNVIAIFIMGIVPHIFTLQGVSKCHGSFKKAQNIFVNFTVTPCWLNIFDYHYWIEYVITHMPFCNWLRRPEKSSSFRKISVQKMPKWHENKN